MSDIKRLNYFNSQFLVDQDFNDEQAYHMEMRRRLNRALNTWGVADGGLDVTGTAGSKQVSIGAGMAIDKNGREMVLLDSNTVDLSAAAPNSNVYITIQYRDVQDPADHYTSGGVDNYTRWTERPAVNSSTNVPPSDGSVIPLGMVHLDASGNVTLPIDTSLRPIANSKINPESSLVVGSLSVNGKVGIGTTTPGMSLEVTQPSYWSSPAIGGANGGRYAYLHIGAADHSLIWDQNAAMRFGTETSRGAGYSERMRITGTGNVGIGTSNPTRKLEINGTQGNLLWVGASAGSTGNIELSGHVQLREYSTNNLSYLQARDDSSNRDIGLRIRTQKAGATTPSLTEAVTIDGSGNLGIGTQNPTAKLHISGGGNLLWVGASTGSGGAIELSGNVVLREYLTDNHAVISARDLSSNRDIGLRINTQRAGATSPSGANVLTIEASGNILAYGNISTSGNLSFGSATRQMVNLWGTQYGIGVQGGTQYYRTASNFAWFQGGTHSDTPFDPGAAGSVQMVINSNGNVGIGTASPTHVLHINDFSGIRQNYLYLGGGAGWSSLTYNAYHNANNSAWVFPDQSRHAVTVEIDDSATNPRFEVWSTVGAAKTSFIRHLALDCNSGNLAIRGALSAGGGKGGYVMDQFINNLGDTLEQGDIVVIGENQTSLYYGQNDNIPIPEIDLAQREYDTRVCGIVTEVHVPIAQESNETYNSGTEATKPKTSKVRKKKASPQQSFTPEELEKLDRTKVESGQIGWMVTLGTFAHCKVDADIAPIKVGDLLTTSPTRGHAQKVLDPSQAVGAIIGKALGSLKKGKGKIPVLVMLQ